LRAPPSARWPPGRSASAWPARKQTWQREWVVSVAWWPSWLEIPGRDVRMLNDAIREARKGREGAEADLFEERRIPSVSALPEHREDVRRNADWLAERFDRLGLVTRITDVPGGRHPVLQADLEVSGSAPWLTIYGHYDVQPPD